MYEVSRVLLHSNKLECAPISGLWRRQVTKRTNSGKSSSSAKHSFLNCDFISPQPTAGRSALRNLWRNSFRLEIQKREPEGRSGAERRERETTRREHETRRVGGCRRVNWFLRWRHSDNELMPTYILYSIYCERRGECGCCVLRFKQLSIAFSSSSLSQK